MDISFLVAVVRDISGQNWNYWNWKLSVCCCRCWAELPSLPLPWHIILVMSLVINKTLTEYLEGSALTKSSVSYDHYGQVSYLIFVFKCPFKGLLWALWNSRVDNSSYDSPIFIIMGSEVIIGIISMPSIGMSCSSDTTGSRGEEEQCLAVSRLTTSTTTWTSIPKMQERYSII